MHTSRRQHTATMLRRQEGKRRERDRLSEVDLAFPNPRGTLVIDVTLNWLQWIALFSSLLGVWASVCGVVRWRRHGNERRCPGSHLGVWRWLYPWNWYLTRACGYDLSRSPVDQDGCVRCPECGTEVARERSMTRAAVWRRLPVGLSLLLIGATAYFGPLMQSGDWVRLIPTRVLVMTYGIDTRWHPRTLNWELDRRVEGHALSASNGRRLADRIVLNLDDDETRLNARKSIRTLLRLGPVAVPALEKALLSPDRQARHLAAFALTRHHEHDPSDRALRVLIECLRDDRMDLRGNATSAYNRLARQDPARIMPLLREGIRSGDMQQRLLAATLGGSLDMDALLPDAAPLLIDHLRDNEIYGDARIAGPALYRFGQEVIPWLEPYRESDDPQQRYVVQCILHELGFAAKPSNPDRIRVTSLVENPITDLPPDFIGL